MKLTALLNLLGTTFAAAAFAEEGEHETALTMICTKEMDKSTCCSCSVSNRTDLGTLPSAA